MSLQSEFKSKVASTRSIVEFIPGTIVKTKSGKDYVLTCKTRSDYHPDFTPAYTPIEMLEMGIFEGKYLNDCVGEYPREFFENAKVSLTTPNENLNFFKIKSRTPLSTWNENGWINEQDPKGWFEWYCRYYLGRRTEDDIRQIKRWKAFTRHAGQIKKNCPGDLSKRTRQRQALLQWAHDAFI